ncbi:ribonuclease HI family protein [soil metagenome]
MAEIEKSAPLKKGRYLLNTDGGMKSDGRRPSDDQPGEAAIGVVLNDPDDRLVQTINEAIGRETIQGAEYRAVIKGLELALDLGIDKIRAYVDNQLVVDQVNGLAKVNSEHLKPHYEKALALLERFTDQRVYWVPRERNKDADALVRAKLYP